MSDLSSVVNLTLRTVKNVRALTCYHPDIQRLEGLKIKHLMVINI